MTSRWREQRAEKGVSKSEIVRRCLKAKLAAGPYPRQSAYELAKDLIGRHGSGRTDLAQNAEPIVREIIKAKHEKNTAKYEQRKHQSQS